MHHLIGLIAPALGLLFVLVIVSRLLRGVEDIREGLEICEHCGKPIRTGEWRARIMPKGGAIHLEKCYKEKFGKEPY